MRIADSGDRTSPSTSPVQLNPMTALASAIALLVQHGTEQLPPSVSSDEGFRRLDMLSHVPEQQVAAKLAADARKRALEARLRQQVRDARIALDAMDDRGTVDAQFYAIMGELQRTWRRIRDIEAQ